VLKNKRNRPTALVCFNDIVAIGAYRAAHELGLQVPDDISIVGFDDIDIASELGPPLTTVATHGREIGKAAAEILLAAIEDENRGRILSRAITGALVERGSVRAR
jgi:DNA-binding LacI/PurR family transcriptional regulator